MDKIPFDESTHIMKQYLYIAALAITLLLPPPTLAGNDDVWKGTTDFTAAHAAALEEWLGAHPGKFRQPEGAAAAETDGTTVSAHGDDRILVAITPASPMHAHFKSAADCLMAHRFLDATLPMDNSRAQKRQRTTKTEAPVLRHTAEWASLPAAPAAHSATPASTAAHDTEDYLTMLGRAPIGYDMETETNRLYEEFKALLRGGTAFTSPPESHDSTPTTATQQSEDRKTPSAVSRKRKRSHAAPEAAAEDAELRRATYKHLDLGYNIGCRPHSLTMGEKNAIQYMYTVEQLNRIDIATTLNRTRPTIKRALALRHPKAAQQGRGPTPDQRLVESFNISTLKHPYNTPFILDKKEISLQKLNFVQRLYAKGYSRTFIVFRTRIARKLVDNIVEHLTPPFKKEEPASKSTPYVQRTLFYLYIQYGKDRKQAAEITGLQPQLINEVIMALSRRRVPPETASRASMSAALPSVAEDAGREYPPASPGLPTPMLDPSKGALGAATKDSDKRDFASTPPPLLGPFPPLPDKLPQAFTTGPHPPRTGPVMLAHTTGVEISPTTKAALLAWYRMGTADSAKILWQLSPEIAKAAHAPPPPETAADASGSSWGEAS